MTTSSAAEKSAPRRHVLRPGVHAVPVVGGQVRVGHDGRAVVLPGDPLVRSLVGRLAGDGAARPRATDPHTLLRAWERLHGADLVIPATAVARAHEVLAPTRRRGPHADRDDVARGLADALLLRHGDRAATVAEARTSATVALHGPPALATPAVEALATARLRRTTDDARAGVHLLLADIRPDDRVLERLVPAHAPHLSVLRDADGIRVGPFVVPGTTACLGCVEAERADRDPDAGLARLHRSRAGRGLTPPGDPALLAAALALAARELAVWACGDRPSTWSATLWLGADGSHRREEHRRHARCGCAWDAVVAAGG